MIILLAIFVGIVVKILLDMRKPPLTVEDVLSGRVTEDQYKRDYFFRVGHNPPPDSRLHPRPKTMPPPPPIPIDKRRCNRCKKNKRR